MILVTGGCGYIGSHTVVELMQAGEKEIVIADNLCNSKIDVLDRIEKLTGVRPYFYEVDIRDAEGLRAMFRERNIDAVIHFAGLKAVGESCREPHLYYENNISGTLTLLRVMAEYGCKQIVFSSSATVYGMNNEAPYNEEMPTSATNPYGWTKVMQEQILRDISAADPDFRVALLRYFNPIGAHGSGLLGENPNGIPNNLLPYICKVAVGSLPKLNVFGDDYPTHDGTGVRDYIHVVDLARGHVCAIRYLRENPGVLTVNLGTGIGYSVLDVVKAYEKASGKRIPYEICPRRPGDIATCYANPARAEALLGWRAEYDLDRMCADAWNFAYRNL